MERSYYDPCYYGTSTWWKHPLFNYLYTDSVRDFCKTYGAYWLLDVVGSYMDVLKQHDFVLLTVDVDGDKAVFYAQTDTGRKHFIHQDIEYTDLKVSVQLYLEHGEAYVLMFPSDH